MTTRTSQDAGRIAAGVTGPVLGALALWALVPLFGCGGPSGDYPGPVRTEFRHLRVDEETLRGDDYFAVIEPVYWTVDIYNGPGKYERTLAPFSRAQRHLLAVHWYCSEVFNGGHDQFYDNTTGIVWRDALEAFQAMELDEFASVLQESAERMGGPPSLDREERQAALIRLQPDFDDLDRRFYSLDETMDLQRRLLDYARAHAEEVRFDGTVEISVIAPLSEDSPP
jgi:hypothetical protein